MRELQGSLDASGLALEEARKAVSVKGAEYERMEAKYEAAEGEAASLRDEVALKQKEVYRLEEEMVQRVEVQEVSASQAGAGPANVGMLDPMAMMGHGDGEGAGDAKVHMLQRQLDESAHALQLARKAVAAKSVECEQMTARYEAAESEGASVRDELVLKQKEVHRLEEDLSKAMEARAGEDASLAEAVAEAEAAA